MDDDYPLLGPAVCGPIARRAFADERPARTVKASDAAYLRRKRRKNWAPSSRTMTEAGRCTPVASFAFPSRVA